jgi:hypothetical protein
MAGKLGKPIDLSGIRVRFNRVYKVGVELEGGWTKIPAGTRIGHDGSVHVGHGDSLDQDHPIVHIGELPSPPLSPEELPGWMAKFYPQAVNQTCGMHVHLSFKNAMSYQRIMVNTYPATILAEVELWAKKVGLPKDHAIWDRLAGKSRYCQHIFSADEQATNAAKDFDQNREGNRYSVVNYCYGRYTTAECRLLPMMKTPEQGLEAVQEIMRITNAFLVATARRERAVVGGVALDDEPLIVHRRVNV